MTITARIALVAATLMLLLSCDDTTILNSYKAVSPDRKHTAIAETTEYGGPGGAALITTIGLDYANGNSENVFTIEHDQRSTAGVFTVWKGSLQIDIYYYGGKVDFQKPVSGNVRVSLHDVKSLSEFRGH